MKLSISLQIVKHTLRENSRAFILVNSLLFLASGLSLLKPWLLGELLGAAAAGDMALFQQLLFALGALLAILAFVNYQRLYRQEVFTQRILSQLKANFLEKLLALPLPLLQSRHPGEFLANLNSDLTKVQAGTLGAAANIIRHGVIFLGSIVLLAGISWPLTILLLTVLVPLVLTAKIYGRRGSQITANLQKQNGVGNALAAEALDNVVIAKALRQETFISSLYREILDQQVESAGEDGRNKGKQAALVNLFSGIFLLIVCGSGLLAGFLTTDELVKFFLYGFYINGAMSGLAELYGLLKRADGAASRLVPLLDGPQEILQGLAVKNVAPIEISNLSYTYLDRPTVKVIKNLSLTIRAGEKIILTGPSGCGKSTLLAILGGFYKPDAGTITIGGVDLQKLSLAQWRSRIGLITQETKLFCGTIWQNIVLDKKNIAPDKVEEVCRLVGLWPFISQLPGGLSTQIGLDGLALSGGQGQRLALARALIRDPQLLLLDEPTTALDQQAEEELLATLRQLPAELTIILIAHRPLAAFNADRIIFWPDIELEQ